MKLVGLIENATKHITRPFSRLRVSVVVKVILPFVIAVLANTGLIADVCCSSVSFALNQNLQTKTHALSSNLAKLTADPFEMGEWNRVQSILEAAQTTDSDVRYIIIAAPDGQILASTDPKKKPETYLPSGEMSALRVSSYSVQEDSKNPVNFDALAPLRSGSSQLAVIKIGMSRKSINAVLTGIQNQIILVGIFAIAGGILFYYVTIQGLILNPITHLSSIAYRSAKGNIVEEIKVENNDEIGVLGESMGQLIQYFSDMAQIAKSIADGNLKVTVHERSDSDSFAQSFRQMVESLQIVVVKLADGSQLLQETAAKLSASSEDQTKKISEQYSALAEWMNTLENIRNAVTSGSEQASLVLSLSEKSLEGSNKGMESLSEATTAMLAIRDYQAQISLTIEELTQHAVKINDITTLVDEVSVQSEVLTVNGAIEAARAGETGRAFAVVAKEVRNLSVQSKAATARVRQTLAKIEESMGVVSNVLQEGQNRISLGVKQITGVANNFNDLYSVIIQSAQAIKSFADSSRRHVTQINEMSEAMNELAKAASDSVQGAAGHSETAQELNAVAGRLNAILLEYSFDESVRLVEERSKLAGPHALPHQAAPISNQIS